MTDLTILVEVREEVSLGLPLGGRLVGEPAVGICAWNRLASAEAHLEGLAFFENLESKSARAVMLKEKHAYFSTPLTQVHEDQSLG